jgi:hypothetical protein
MSAKAGYDPVCTYLMRPSVAVAADTYFRPVVLISELAGRVQRDGTKLTVPRLLAQPV